MSNRFILKKSVLNGEIVIPPSKSQTLRAILFGLMGKGKTIVHHYLNSQDTKSMIEACKLFGAEIKQSENQIEIVGLNGKINAAENVIDAGNSGIVLRFCSAISALSNYPIVITGDHSIRHQRPMHTLLDGLSQLGVRAESMRSDGFAPVIIKGPIENKRVKIKGEDSQPVSALIIALAFAKNVTELFVENPGEKPWVNMTLSWLDRLGISYEAKDHEYYRLFGNSSYEGFEYVVPGDMSSAAFPIAAALITKSELTLKNIDISDLQGDKELINVFIKMGAKIDIDEKNKTLHVKKDAKLSGVEVDINNFIDAITILAVVACYAEGETVIYNAKIARQKECNRIDCVATELKKMGADITATEDGLLIKSSKLKGANVHSYNDHRMVMSLSVAALGAKDETFISDIECVSKTFPSFLSDFKTLGASIEKV